MEQSLNKVILLVEDEAIQAMAGKAALEKYGYAVMTANTGEKAIDLIDSRPDIDLILMDIDLGKGIDGTQAAALILSRRDIPVVFLSSHTESEIVEKTEKITSYGYVVKNSSLTVLDASIKMAFKLFYANKKTEESENKYKFLANSVPDIIYSLDREGKISTINSSSFSRYGYTEEASKGKSFFDFICPDDRETVMASFMTAMKERRVKTTALQFRIAAENGTLVWFELNSNARYDAEGGYLGEEGVLRDITERKISEKELLEKEERFRQLFVNLNTNFALHEIILDDAGKPCDYRFLEVNPAFEKEIGMKAADIVGKTAREIFPKTERYWIDKFAETALTRIPMHYEYYSAELEKYYDMNIYSPEKGQFALLGLDITDRKRAETALQAKNGEYETLNEELRATVDELQNTAKELNAASEVLQIQNEELLLAEQTQRRHDERQTKILKNLGDVIVIIDEDGINRYKSPNVEKLFGWTPEELVGKSTWLNVHADDVEKMRKQYAEIVEKPGCTVTVECRYLCKAGQTKWISITMTNLLHDKDIRGVLGNYHDITERKKVSEQLRESEEIYRSILTASPDSIIITDLAGTILFVSPRTLTALKCVEEDIVGHRMNDFIVPEDRPRATENVALMFQGIMTGIGEYGAIRRDGKIIDIEINAEFIRDEKGQPIKIIFISRDITERKRIGDKYKQLFELLPVGMAMIDHKTGAFLEANKSLLRSTGYSREEFLKLSFWDLTPQEDAQFAELNETEIIRTNEKEYIRKDGTRYPISISGAKLTDENGTEVVWGIIEDISELRNDELKIKSLLAEKELTLKEVHHRIKNNMNAIHGLLTLQSNITHEKSVGEALQDAASRVKSMQVLYEKLYRSAVFTELPVSEYFSPLIDEILASFPNRSTITLEKDIPDFSLDAVVLQPLGIILNELLTNIMKYAFTGKIEGTISVAMALKDEAVTMTITDNGNGMPESVSFENSSGFGLVLVNALVQQLEGSIRIERGKGTKIVLEFGI